ncbi:MAG: hypothetical protein M3022_06145 [Actinomycetota bacterium]|nr:hypothetical protein [Actinomycetota bacterium]
MAEVIQIPAEYLEDVRSALVKEIHDDSKALRTDQDDVLRGSLAGPEDRGAAMRILREDVLLLDQVLDASGSTTMTGERGALTHVLDAMTRVVSGQLVDRCEYAPIDMRAVAGLAERLGWATAESSRLKRTPVEAVA